MIRNASIPTAASQAIHSLTSSSYKSFLPHLSSQRTNSKPTRYIAHQGAVPIQKNRNSTIKSFTYRFGKIHAYTLTSCSWRESSIPEENRFSRRWNERTESLWWSVLAFKSFAAKRVVRSYGVRKLRKAFVESLKKRGIASDGSWLDHEGQNKDAVMGTASLMPEIEILATSMEDLILETDEVVERILSMQSTRDFATKKPPKGRHGTGTHSTLIKGNSGSPRGAGTGLKITRG